MKIALFSSQPYDREYFEKYKDRYDHQLTYFESALHIHTVGLAKGYDAVCVFVNDKLDADVLAGLSAHGVRLIALRCAGYNNVDLKALHGIKVVRVPAYSPEAIAEHALALILTLNRKTHKAYNRVREGNFSLDRLMGFNLYQKTIGVIGTGKIGAAFCKVMRAFDCEILAFDPYPSNQLQKSGVKYLELPELLGKSDIVSLHCPLTPQTKQLINEQSIALMKDNVMLINTSRGGLIDTADIIEALKSKKVGYLGIDVYEQEEKIFYKDLSESIIEDDMILRLNSFPNVLITSHQAYLTREAMEEITLTTFDNITAFEKGEELQNEVN